MKTQPLTRKKLKILMLNYEFPPLGGGGGVAAKKLAEGFIQEGYEVDYITTWFKGLPEFEQVNGINVYRIKVLGRKELPTATMQSLISFPNMAYKKARELCEKNKYEFINTQFAIPTGPLGIWLSRRYKLKNILSLHGGDIYDPTKKNSPHNKWYLRKVVRWVLNNSDSIVAQSSNTRKNALEIYKPNKEIKIIPLPYTKYNFKNVTREKLGLADDLIYLISIGRVVKRKGYDFLIKSLARIDNKKVHSIIVGDGPELDSLKELANSLQVSDRVHFVGSVTEEQKFQYLANSDIYALSSVHEGFGIVLQEAMQVGLPIVATDNGGQVDIVKEGENGFLIKYGDEIGFADRVERLIKDGKLRALMGKNNMEKIKDYEIVKIVKGYLEVGR